MGSVDFTRRVWSGITLGRCLAKLTVALGLAVLLPPSVFGQAAPPAATQPVPSALPRRPIPEAKQLESVQAKVGELYGAQLDAAKQPGEKKTLAATILATAQESQDDASAYYALLQQTRELYIACADIPKALEVTKLLSDDYELDATQELLSLMTKFSEDSKLPPAAQAEAAKAALETAQEFADLGDYKQGLRFARIALESARKSRDAALVKQVTAAGKDLLAQQSEAQEIAQAEQKIAADPLDPAANLALGRWFWFRKNDPFTAMPYLAKTADSPLKKAAAAELENPTEPAAQLAIAEQWLAVGQSVKDDAIKTELAARALGWYQLALPKLASLDKVKAERRIAELAKTAGNAPGTKPGGGKHDLFADRQPAARATVALAAGGTKESEEAVERALQWLASVQARDGGWNFDTRAVLPGTTLSGTASEARNGATGLALLPFLAAGYTHKTRNPYQATIRKGLVFLTNNSNPRYTSAALGTFAWLESQGTMYSHGLAAAAMAEAYAMTRDKALLPYAQGGINFITAAQDPAGGGWRYVPRERGDTSVFGWQFMALKSAAMGKLAVNPATIKGTVNFLNTVSKEDDVYAYYGYSSPGVGSATTAIGLLCRMHLGWKKDNPGLSKGIQYLVKLGLHPNNCYFNYYATQVFYQWGGEEWQTWNKQLLEQLLRSQSTKDADAGSWHPGGKDHATESGGRLCCTALSCLTLQVYYRYPKVLDKNAPAESLVY